MAEAGGDRIGIEAGRGTEKMNGTYKKIGVISALVCVEKEALFCV